MNLAYSREDWKGRLRTLCPATLVPRQKAILARYNVAPRPRDNSSPTPLSVSSQYHPAPVGALGHHAGRHGIQRGGRPVACVSPVRRVASQPSHPVRPHDSMKFVGSPQFLTPFLFHVQAEVGIQNHVIRSNALRLLPYGVRPTRFAISPLSSHKRRCQGCDVIIKDLTPYLSRDSLGHLCRQV